MSIGNTADILMISYNRPFYTRMALSQLLETCPASVRVWVWHNGEDPDTLAVINSMRNHPRFFCFYHSSKNQKLREPTNWFWDNAKGDYLGKVDDDCLMPDGWGERLLDAHKADSRLGILGSWPFLLADLREKLVARKTIKLSKSEIMQNPWVGGSGYLMKRACLERCGLLRSDEGFTSYCMRVARAGWVNGWLLPMILMDHMDDPRSEHTVFRTDEDVVPTSWTDGGATRH